MHPSPLPRSLPPPPLRSLYKWVPQPDEEEGEDEAAAALDRRPSAVAAMAAAAAAAADGARRAGVSSSFTCFDADPQVGPAVTPGGGGSKGAFGPDRVRQAFSATRGGGGGIRHGCVSGLLGGGGSGGCVGGWQWLQATDMCVELCSSGGSSSRGMLFARGS